MISYYTILKLLREHLIADRNVNSVVLESLGSVDTKKQTMFPLAHLVVTDSNNVNNLSVFNVTIAIFDLVKENLTDEFSGDDWKLKDNKQDVLNTLKGVFDSLEKSLKVGSLRDLGFYIESNFNLKKVEDEYKNVLSGWTCDAEIMVVKEVDMCGNSNTLGDITFSNTLITFSNNNG